jgi:hypothetical protein
VVQSGAAIVLGFVVPALGLALTAAR